MTRTPLIIDCDPGVDDAIALFLAFASPETFDILAVTTVGGNVNADHTARNACILRQLAGREDVPIHSGALKPIVRAPVTASTFHGVTGLGDFPIFQPARSVEARTSADAIIDIVMSRPARSVAIAAIGPLTNLALALQREPAIAARLGPVVIMGGARSEGGNVTASAEFNIYADPHAADIVFSSQCRPTVIGLDATHQVRVTPDRLAAIGHIETPSGRAAFQLLTFANRIEREVGGGAESPLHDPCTIAFLLAPELFRLAPVCLQVETASPLTMGHTAVEFRLHDCAPNADWVTHIDADGLFKLLLARLAR